MKFVLLINFKLLTIANSFLLNIAEHENFSANKYENANPIVGIFIFISRENFMLSWVEHEKSFITSRPGISICVVYILWFLENHWVRFDDLKIEYRITMGQEAWAMLHIISLFMNTLSKTKSAIFVYFKRFSLSVFIYFCFALVEFISFLAGQS